MGDEIDWEDNSGIIGFEEWEKRTKSKEIAKKYLGEIDETSVKDWIELILFLNNKKMQKTQLFKELFLVGERLGLNDFSLFNWVPYHYGPYSITVEDKLEELKKDKIITINRKDTSKIYTLNQEKNAQDIWESFPETVKEIILEVVKDFEGKTVKEIKDYIYAAYPKYAVNVQ